MIAKNHNDKAVWVNTGGWYSCSACGSEPPNETNETTPYCLSCGADMENCDANGVITEHYSFAPSSKHPNLDDFIREYGVEPLKNNHHKRIY